jgi:hypothetical protein
LDYANSDNAAETAWQSASTLCEQTLMGRNSIHNQLSIGSTISNTGVNWKRSVAPTREATGACDILDRHHKRFFDQIAITDSKRHSNTEMKQRGIFLVSL